MFPCIYRQSHIKPPWRNWLARSAVNRKVGGSSPPGGANFFGLSEYICKTSPHPCSKMSLSACKRGLAEKKKLLDPGRTRTYNLLLRRQTRYPLRHWTIDVSVEHWHGHFKPNSSRQILLLLALPEQSFRSVVVITCASHAQGPRFEPGRKQIVVPFWYFWYSLDKQCITCYHQLTWQQCRVGRMTLRPWQ